MALGPFDKKFDFNQDGTLDPQEKLLQTDYLRESAQKLEYTRETEPPQEKEKKEILPGRSLSEFDRQFDVDQDGDLDSSEREARYRFLKEKAAEGTADQ